MPVRIRARNFQSIEDAEIVVDRFTVVTGPNNSGKTALQRAVQGVFTNPSGDAFVRHGAERLIVDIDFGNDETVRWEKGPKVKPTYTVKGKVINPGRQVPTEVLALGIQPIQAGAIAVWPQVAPQFTGQMFLLDLPGSAIAEAVADVERVGQLTQALRLADSDKRSASSELKVRKKDVEAITTALGDFSGLDAVGAVVSAIENTVAVAKETRGKHTQVESLRTRIQAASEEIKRLAGVRDVKVPPEVETTKALSTSRALVQMQAVRVRLATLKADVAGLSGVREVNVPLVPPAIREAKVNLSEALGLQQRLRRSRAALKATEGVKTAIGSFDEAGLQQKYDSALRVQKALAHYESTRTRLKTARTDLATLQSTLSEKQALLATTESDIREVLGGLGSCPVCRTTITGSHAH